MASAHGPTGGESNPPADPEHAFYDHVAADVTENVALAFIGVGGGLVDSRGRTTDCEGDLLDRRVGKRLAHAMDAGRYDPRNRRPTAAGRGSKWIWAATVMRLIECALLAAAIWLGAHLLGYT